MNPRRKIVNQTYYAEWLYRTINYLDYSSIVFFCLKFDLFSKKNYLVKRMKLNRGTYK